VKRLWRLCPEAHSARPLDGEGARLYGGRWNPKGVQVVYLAEHLSLAVLEVVVHVDPEDAPSHLAFGVDIPHDATIEVVDPDSLTRSWRDPSPPPELQHFGARWAQQRRSLLLEVPSVVVPEERVFVLNPEHPQARRVRLRQGSRFELDPRLLKR
jgi:RES domain-containing protein